MKLNIFVTTDVTWIEGDKWLLGGMYSKNIDIATLFAMLLRKAGIIDCPLNDWIRR